MDNILNIISIAVTSLISMVAIAISIKTAQHQNKIALFEKRFELYEQEINYFDQAENYINTNDRCSITSMELMELESRHKINIEKAKYLFDNRISMLLKQAEEYFKQIIHLYKQNELNQQAIDEIKNKIVVCHQKFDNKTKRFLKL